MSQQKTVLSQEKKKVKITNITNAARQYPYNNAINYVHHIAVEGSNFAWEYHSTKPTVDKFKVGDVVEFEMKVEQRVNNGQTYTDYKIRTIDEGGGKGKGKFEGRTIDEGAIIMQSCIASACVLHAEKGGSTGSSAEEVLITANKFYKAVVGKSTTQTQYKP